MGRLKGLGQALAGLILVFCFVNKTAAYPIESNQHYYPLSSNLIDNSVSDIDLAFMGMDYPLIEEVIQETLGVKGPVETYLYRAFYGTIIFKVPANVDTETMRLRIERVLDSKGVRGEVFKLHERGVVVHAIFR